MFSNNLETFHDVISIMEHHYNIAKTLHSFNIVNDDPFTIAKFLTEKFINDNQKPIYIGLKED